MKISIVTPSFNQAPFLKETILSVINQDWPHIEYFVVDGGSTDDSVAIIKEFSSSIDWWVSEKDSGQSHAINKGLQKVTGDIIGWINSDDYYEPNVFRSIVQSFKNNPQADVIYFDVRNLSGTSEHIFHHQPFYPPELFLTKVCLHQPGVFWRRSIMEQIGFLDENLHYVMDFDLWIRMYLNGQLKYIPHVVSNFRIHNDSKTHNDPVELYQEKNKVLARVFYTHKAQSFYKELEKLELTPSDVTEYLPAKKQLSASVLKEVFIRHIVNNAYLCFRTGDYHQSRLLLNYLKTNNYSIPARTYFLKMKLLLRGKFNSRKSQ